MRLHLDPRTKLFLILLCVLSAVFAPDLCIYRLVHGRTDRHMANDVCGVSRFGT